MTPQGAPFVRRAADQEPLGWVGGARLRLVLTGEESGGALTLVEIAADAGYAAAAHVHDREDETFVVLAGSAVVTVDGAEHELDTGDTVWLPRRRPHAYRVTANSTRLLHASTPGGLDGFFREAAADPSRLLEVAARYGVRYS